MVKILDKYLEMLLLFLEQTFILLPALLGLASRLGFAQCLQMITEVFQVPDEISAKDHNIITNSFIFIQASSPTSWQIIMLGYSQEKDLRVHFWCLVYQTDAFRVANNVL